MGNVDSNEEILEYAISREVEAYYFCLALAGRVDTPRMRQVFEDMAAEELEHKAKLELEIIPVEALCRHCGERFAPGANDFLCPRCERADAEIIAGDDIVLSSVSGERNGGDADEDQCRD